MKKKGVDRVRGMGARRLSYATWGLLGLGLLLLEGCASVRVPVEELPPEPIAFVYWTDKTSDKRSQAFEKAREMFSSPQGMQQLEEIPEIEVRRTMLTPDDSFPVLQSREKYPGRLMLYWPRRDELERVEAAPVNSIPLAWSSDRKRLLFSSSHRRGRPQLYEYDVERKDLRRVTQGPEVHARGDYGPDGRLVVHRESTGGRGFVAQDLEVRDGTGRVHFRVGENVAPGMISFSPLGDRVVYETIVNRPRRAGPTLREPFIATRELVPGAPEKLLLKGREPVFTPDGKWVVFASRSAAGYRLRRMWPDGTHRVPLGPKNSEERMPTVSPDGNYVAFVKEVAGLRRLVVRRFDGSGERILISDGWCESPVW